MTKKAPRVHIDDFAALVGQEIGLTEWMTVDQERVDAFARATDDLNPLHVDPEWAGSGPFGGTVAHGFLTLSMLASFAYEIGLAPDGIDYGVNYGLERVRFMAPVPVGSRIRNRTTLKAVEPKGNGRYVVRTRNVIEVEGSPRPAMVAEWLNMYAKAKAEAAE